MNTTIQVTKHVISKIKTHGEASFPNECCGFLYGTEKGSDRIITVYKPVENSKEGDQRRRFEIAPIEYVRAERYAEENDLHFLGIFHTHPNHPAIASKWDLEKAMPYFSYLIASIQDGEMADIRSWRLFDEERKFFEEQVSKVN